MSDVISIFLAISNASAKTRHNCCDPRSGDLPATSQHSGKTRDSSVLRFGEHGRSLVGVTFEAPSVRLDETHAQNERTWGFAECASFFFFFFYKCIFEKLGM